jgi:alpha-D-ribose 1-methylphosphonate 5-triphosphate synthase subunit PhnG
MWCYVSGNESLPGAHSAIVDARAQSAAVADKRFGEYIGKPVSMIAMTDVWASKRKNRDVRDEELKRKIP